MKNKVTKEDLKGEIKDFPIEVVQRMCECQVEQGNEFNPYVFVVCERYVSDKGGFHWARTTEDYEFWEEVIDSKNFDLFFEKYPKQEAEQKQETKMETELKIPDGYEFDCIENGVIKLKAIKKELPKTWEECIEVGKTYYYIDADAAISSVMITSPIRSIVNRNLLPSAEIARAMRAFTTLIMARDRYRDGWIPDWCYGDKKYCIKVTADEVELDTSLYDNYTLSFQCSKIRHEFLENFKDLMEEAKELL
ncbi:MAG: hypothetical protein ACRCZY_11700 [Phocaeicola sp.]